MVSKSPNWGYSPSKWPFDGLYIATKYLLSRVALQVHFTEDCSSPNDFTYLDLRLFDANGKKWTTKYDPQMVGTFHGDLPW